MRSALRHLLRLDWARPFVLAHRATGDHTPLLALCDLIEESDDATYYPLARTVRAALLAPTGGDQ